MNTKYDPPIFKEFLSFMLSHSKLLYYSDSSSISKYELSLMKQDPNHKGFFRYQTFQLIKPTTPKKGTTYREINQELFPDVIDTLYKNILFHFTHQSESFYADTPESDETSFSRIASDFLWKKLKEGNKKESKVFFDIIFHNKYNKPFQRLFENPERDLRLLIPILSKKFLIHNNSIVASFLNNLAVNSSDKELVELDRYISNKLTHKELALYIDFLDKNKFSITPDCRKQFTFLHEKALNHVKVDNEDNSPSQLFKVLTKKTQSNSLVIQSDYLFSKQDILSIFPNIDYDFFLKKIKDQEAMSSIYKKGCSANINLTVDGTNIMSCGLAFESSNLISIQTKSSKTLTSTADYDIPKETEILENLTAKATCMYLFDILKLSINEPLVFFNLKSPRKFDYSKELRAIELSNNLLDKSEVKRNLKKI